MNPQDPQTPPAPQQPPYPAQPTQGQPVQPAAYDAHGRPLYAHPPAHAQAPVQPQPQQPVQQPQQAPTQPVPGVPTDDQNPQYVHMVRPMEPPEQEVTPEIKAKHEESMRRFPTLNLSKGEYIIRAVRRHPIGLFIPMAVGVFLLTVALTILVGYEAIVDQLGLTGPVAEPTSIILPVLLFCAAVGLGMFIVYYIYVNNKFFLTNESVIQEIQVGLFNRHEQTVSLGNIEDASFVQDNIIQHLFNYGSIRLSTEGDETTYRFTYVANPKDHIAKLNNAVEAFKLGRPVDPTGSDT